MIDDVDGDQADGVRKQGFQCRAMQTLMRDDGDRDTLAHAVLGFCDDLVA